MRMRSLRPLGAAGALGLALTLTLTACGDSGSSSGTTTSTSAAASGSGSASSAATKCDPVPGQEIVVLDDDKNLITVDNVIPAINAKAATPAMIAALDKVSAALDTPKLIALNKAVDVDRKTATTAAKEFVTANNLTGGLSGGSGKIVVGAANFGENQTLAAIYATVLTAAGFEASTQTIGNRQLYEPALEKGTIQVVPEYVGTLTEFLNKKANGPNAPAKASGDLDATLQALTQLGTKAGLKFAKPADAVDQNAFAVTKAFADKYGVKTLSDLAAKCAPGSVSFGGPPECPKNVFCQPGLEKTYGLKFSAFKSLDAGGPLTKTAIKQGTVAMGEVFSSDGSLGG